MSNTDKRKANRIQGGWAKGKDKEKTDKSFLFGFYNIIKLISEIFETSPQNFDNQMGLQFDNEISLDPNPTYNLFEVK